MVGRPGLSASTQPESSSDSLGYSADFAATSFLPFSADADINMSSTVTKANDKAKQATKPKSKTKQTKKKVLLGDRNGRGCSAKLKEKLGENFEVTSFVKPNGKLKHLIESIAPLTKNFNENDCVIILGTTDVGIDENYNLNLKPAVKTILETAKKTKRNSKCNPPKI